MYRAPFPCLLTQSALPTNRDDTRVPVAGAKAVAQGFKIDILSGHEADQLVSPVLSLVAYLVLNNAFLLW